MDEDGFSDSKESSWFKVSKNAFLGTVILFENLCFAELLGASELWAPFPRTKPLMEAIPSDVRPFGAVFAKGRYECQLS